MIKEVLPVLQAFLIQHEGWKNEIYIDSVGKRTIGVGHNIDDDDSFPAQVTALGDEEIITLLEQDMLTALDDCFSLFENYGKLPLGVKVVLADMAFNLGRPALSKFKKLKAAIENNDFETAAQEAYDSKWARQVKGRATFLTNILEAHKGWV